MGGKAFKNLLPNGTFPRMHPTVYNALKAQFLPILQSLYAHAAVSPEAPGKVNYGDLDIVVTGPREGLTHEQLKDALRATCSVPAEGNRTSNFAIPAGAFEDIAEACRKVAALNADAMDTAPDTGIFFQVDVNVCADHVQWERTVFYSSLSDLGYFLGLFAQTAGLSFNIYGMKLVEPIQTYPAQTFYVSSSMDDVLSLFELSMERWKQGFATEDEIFAWLATSPFAHPLAARYRSSEYQAAAAAKDRVCERPMRKHFAEYLCVHGVAAPATSLFAQEGRTEEKVAAALKFFGKAEEHAALIYKSRAQKHSKELLNGTNVMAWTGLAGMPVRAVMEEVKERLVSLSVGAGADAAHAVGEAVPAWQRALLDVSENDIRALVVTVKEEMAKDGRLDFDWRAAKAARLEKKRQKELAALSMEDHTTAVVAVA